MPYANVVRRSVGPTVQGQRHGYATNVLRQLERQSPGVDRPGRLFGLELELISLRPFTEVAGHVISIFNDHPVFICKSDGSLPSMTGFEVVTTPMDRAEALEFVTEFAPRVRRFAKSGPAAGLHIHTARPPEHVLQYLGRFIRNEENSRFITKIAGRAENTWCIRNGVGHDHGSAVSLSHHGTVEFRLFSSTLHRTRLRGAVEFVDAIIGWAQHEYEQDRFAGNEFHSRESSRMGYLSFVSWLENQEYPNLKKVVNAEPAYPTHLRALHPHEMLDADAENEIPPEGVSALDPDVERAMYPRSDAAFDFNAAERRIMDSVGVAAPGIRLTFGRNNTANRRVRAEAPPRSTQLLTYEGNLNIANFDRVREPNRSLGTGRGGNDGPRNRDVANYIRQHMTVNGRQAAFNRRAYHMWYDRECQGRLTSHRGITRSGQALWDHATYHANRVLEGLGYVRNARPWGGNYVFEVPASVPTPEPPYNGFEPNIRVQCSDISPDRMWRCTMTAGHPSDHQALLDRRDTAAAARRWLREEPHDGPAETVSGEIEVGEVRITSRPGLAPPRFETLVTNNMLDAAVRAQEASLNHMVQSQNAAAMVQEFVDTTLAAEGGLRVDTVDAVAMSLGALADSSLEEIPF